MSTNIDGKKPLILFFSRDYQSILYPKLVSDQYDSIHATLNRKEKENVSRAGAKVVGCLEEEYEDLLEADISFPYLQYSLGSDRFLRGYTHAERLTILRKEAAFWSAILDKYQPDMVINEVVAIEVSEVLLVEATKRNIPYNACGAFSIQNSFYWFNRPYHSSMADRINSAVPEKKHYDIAEQYLEKVHSGTVQNPYIKGLRGSKDIKNLILKTITLMILMINKLRVRNKVIRQICYQESLSYYRSEIRFYLNYVFRGRGYDKLEDLKRPGTGQHFFYPLHFEPESTLFYASAFYDNQLALIENLAKCLSENQVLVIKEHPAQPGFLSQKIFKDLKKRFANLLFLKADIKSLSVINTCDVVVTLVSTAGFEALALNKPVIVLGKIYYDAFPGVNFCKSFEEVYDLMRGYKAYHSDPGFIDFLARMITLLNEGNPWLLSNPGIYSDKNLSGIIASIEMLISTE